jgi:hypothetical protein
MAEKYPELEFYETGRMEMIIEILKKDSAALFAPPATEHDISELYIDLKARALPHDPDSQNPFPKNFISFLKQHNGFAWNGIEIYGVEDYEPIPGGYILKNIISMNDYLYELNPQLGEPCGSPLLFIGRSDEDIFLYNEDDDTWEVRDRTDREVYETYDSFPAFFAGTVGGRLGVNRTKE